jgi:hypothetical protein
MQGKKNGVMLKNVTSRPTALVFETFRRSSSVTKIGSEAPVLVTASPRGKRFAPLCGARRPTADVINIPLNNHLPCQPVNA